MKNHYDYIFAGGGLAGLTLLYYILEEAALEDKKILVIDSIEKKQNDRTWCFWEKETAFYDQLVSARWKKLRFQSPTVDRIFPMKRYEYKLIRSIDYYEFIHKRAEETAVTFRTEKIQSIKPERKKASVKTDTAEYTADYVFNSTGLFAPEMTKKDTLLQHFEGWFIETKKPNFDTTVGTLMDFTVSQKHGLTFMYVLPLTKNQALVEFTLFTPELLDRDEYALHLKDYIQDHLNIDDYKILNDEFGVIPMSTRKFPAAKGQNIINIGTAGGYTKASTGYTFKNTHKKVSRIAKRMAAGESPLLPVSFREKMFQWYDMTLLDVLLKDKVPGEKLFTSLFAKNNPETVLAFLTDESSHFEEFKIRNSVPLLPFMISGIKQLAR